MDALTPTNALLLGVIIGLIVVVMLTKGGAR
jgi:type II secretory pathway component PulF